jgi:hypothetical protein
LQLLVGGAAGKGFLEVHLRLQQVGLVVRQEGQHLRRGLVPPVQAAQVGLAQRIVHAGQVHARQHGAHFGAMHRLRVHLRAAFELADDGGRLAVQRDDQFALVVGHRRRHQHAALGQVAHQIEVKRQLLEDRFSKIVSTNSPRSVVRKKLLFSMPEADAFERQSFAEGKLLDPLGDIVQGDRGKHCHEKA